MAKNYEQEAKAILKLVGENNIGIRDPLPNPTALCGQGSQGN